jgi:[ribosomal protein S5]-alanine N-acetyltransferase
MAEARIRIRRVAWEDGAELVAANRASVSLHEPFVNPPCDEAVFRQYLAACDGIRRIGYVARETETGRIAGVINVSEIMRGAFESAFLGYYAVVGFAGRGLMREALSQVIGECFGPVGLHRLEANIQPGNERSRALVQRLGFRLEGFSPRYLKIGDTWRDHERWAILAEEWNGGSPG